MYALFAVYAAVLLRLTVLRDGVLPLHLFQGGVLDLLPFAYYSRMARRRVVFLLVREFGGNIVGFMPLGAFLLWLRGERRPKRAGLTGAAVSGMIETLQYVLGVGRASTGDVALNAMGALLGAAVTRGLLLPLMNERKD
jgi:glycopeptide antibiotics resistance protein